MFGRLGWLEILVIVVLVVVLFGHNKIPGMMKNLADGINIFKKELKNTKTPATDVARPSARTGAAAAQKSKTSVKTAGAKAAPKKQATKKPAPKKSK